MYKAVRDHDFVPVQEDSMVKSMLRHTTRLYLGKHINIGASCRLDARVLTRFVVLCLVCDVGCRCVYLGTG